MRRKHIIRREGQKGVKNGTQIPGLGHKEDIERKRRVEGRDHCPGTNGWEEPE